MLRPKRSWKRTGVSQHRDRLLPVRVALLAVLSAVCLPADELSLEQILDRNLAAVGGPAIQDIRTVKMTAIMVVGGNMEVPMTTLLRRPNLVRTEMLYQGQVVVTAFDGTTAWMMPPGSQDPRQLDEKAAAGLASADLDSSIGALAALKAAGHKFELVSKEEVNGKPAYKIRVTRKNGTVTMYFLDAESFLPVKMISNLPQMGQNLEVESYPSDYSKEGPLVVAHSIDNRVQGRSMMRVTVKKVEINTEMDDAVFRAPAREKPVAGPESSPHSNQ